MPMRVIGGTYRHRKLNYPEDNPNIRPTKDRIRESFFSIVGDITNKSFLDLYAGCGSMGIEAISRGAGISTFVDQDKEAIKYIKENIKSLDLYKESSIMHCTDFEALEEFKNKGIKFDVIYLDPPYELGQYEEVLSYIYSNILVNDNGVVACETNRKINISSSWNQKIKEYHYGKIDLIVLRNIK